VTIETWNSVIFYETGEAVLPFIEKCIEGVSRIVEELDSKMAEPAPGSGAP
jgi:hypothetical protein